MLQILQDFRVKTFGKKEAVEEKFYQNFVSKIPTACHIISGQFNLKKLRN
jgi:hypothetical protein